MSRLLCAVVVTVFCSTLVLAQPLASASEGTRPLAPETPAQHDARMKWWREARFGMFIHFGLYSVAAGEWRGEKTKGNGEWIMNDLHIPIHDYETLLPRFNPTRFDARRWVQIAKDAGMKYIVITTKHHDGFCLFDSKVSGYDVMATPLKRDIMKEMADAAHAAGIQICWYHSIMDWHNPDAEGNAEPNYNKGLPPNPHFDRYVGEYLKPQVKELLTNYGQIGVMWFDGEWIKQWTDADGKDLYAWCRSIQPNVIVNNRVGHNRAGMGGFTKAGGFAGDYATPEQQIPRHVPPGLDWETCMTMNGTWGFKTDDTNWKSSRLLIRHLIEVASKGGNFLLNVGPTGEGEIPQASIERLERIGKWMRTNGQAIDGTTASPFDFDLPWGRATQKPGKLYLHVMHWPTDGKIIVPIRNRITKASLLCESGSNLKTSASDAGVAISVPSKMPNEDATVIELEIDGTPDVIRPTTKPSD